MPRCLTVVPLLCSVALLQACAEGSGGSATDTTPLATPASAESVDEVKLTAPIDSTGAADASRIALCDKLQGRIDACGHTQTFPTFSDWCLDASRDDNAALTTCSIRPCALMVTCLVEAEAPSKGL